MSAVRRDAARPLTAREAEIVALLAGGLRASEIAPRLVLSPDTIKTHLTNIRRRLGARTTAQAVAIAVRDGLADGPTRKEAR